MLNKLKQALMKVPSSQTPQFRTADDELEVRHLGNWISNGEEDNDHERLTYGSEELIIEVLHKFNKENGTRFEFTIDDKNWITFYQE